MQKTIIATAALAVLVGLAGCSSNDDDAGNLDADTDANTSGTSDFNPDLDNGEPPASGPGDDATAISGFWNASEGAVADANYVLITDDGRYTDYTLAEGEGENGGNCHEVDGPFTMTLEIEESSTWSTSNDTVFDATRDDTADPAMLQISFAESETDGPLSWPLVSGIVVDDLQLCSDAAE